MKSEHVKAMFQLAGLPVIKMKALVDGYSYSPDDPRFVETLPRCAWWFCKTEIGWIEIGERKRVIAIDWSETAVRKIITTDETTKDEFRVHAWTELKVVEYLKALKEAAQAAEGLVWRAS